MISIWASSFDSITTVCRDARLRTDLHGWEPAAAAGRETYGQAGWDVGLNFNSLSNLATQIATEPMPSNACGNWWMDCDAVRPGQVERLAIMAHGLSGEVFVNGSHYRPGLRADNINTFAAALNQIGRYLSPSAMVYLMACLSGQGPAGSQLLIALSNLWRGRMVIGFSTVGVAMGGTMLRQGQQCAEPGLRSSNESSPTLDGAPRDYSPQWYDLSRLPWADIGSPFAKCALDGRVVRGQSL